jgi:hypothetical protein
MKLADKQIADNLLDVGNSCVRWNAIIAGTLIALSTEVLLNFLGIGLGLINLDMRLDSMLNVGIGALIWLVVSGIISMAFAGFITGRLINTDIRRVAGLHGLLAWSLATLLTVTVSTGTASALIGGPTNIVKSSIIAVGQKSVQRVEEAYGDNSQPANQANQNDEASASNPSAETTTSNIGKGSIALFIAFLLSAIAGAVGAMLGRNKEPQAY